MISRSVTTSTKAARRYETERALAAKTRRIGAIIKGLMLSLRVQSLALQILSPQSWLARFVLMDHVDEPTAA